MRKASEIRAAEQEYFEKLWWLAHQDLSPRRDTVCIEAEFNALEIEEKYGRENMIGHEAEIEGKLSALRWVLGDEWDNLDT